MGHTNFLPSQGKIMHVGLGPRVFPLAFMEISNQRIHQHGLYKILVVHNTRTILVCLLEVCIKSRQQSLDELAKNLFLKFLKNVIWVNRPIHWLLVGCLNPYLQGTSVQVGSPQPKNCGVARARARSFTQFQNNL
jgi:hypothetical protein